MRVANLRSGEVEKTGNYASRRYRSLLAGATLHTKLSVLRESPYKPDTFHLRLKIGVCPHFCPQTSSKQNKLVKGFT